MRRVGKMLRADPRPVAARATTRACACAGASGGARAKVAPARVWLCQAIFEAILRVVTGHAPAGLTHHTRVQPAHATRPRARPVLHAHLRRGCGGRKRG